MDAMSRKNPLTLLILDGWGHREAAADNAISTGNTPNWDRLWAQCPHGLLQTSGEAVGLPEGQMGNSEVGHMNIGAGRIVYQELTRISKAVKSEELPDNPALLEGLSAVASSGGRVHVMGLLSPGGVHSHEDHFLAIVDMAAKSTAREVLVHAFLDGRDTPPRSAEPSMKRLEALLADLPKASLASVSGRYYAMDRDQRWDRVERAWHAIVDSKADYQADSGSEALSAAYERGEDDEFVQPTLVGAPSPMEDGDVVIFINFRADRARQLGQALAALDFDGFQARRPQLAALVTMTSYQDDLPALVAFPPTRMQDLFGEVLARNNLKQLRIAETEKYAHVTYFFNGGEETVFDGEERVLIPSPKVATYDLKPEMSAPDLTKRLVESIEGGEFDVIVANVANPDMVGHSGKFEAAVAAVEAVDELLGAVVEATGKVDGELLITADHGNVEQMTDPSNGQAHTAHTTNPVPLVYVGSRELQLAEQGSLRDLAPTMLYLLGLDAPEAMSGRSLVN